ncbi:DDE_3 domain-containing protein [Trichonephila clavipes]|nr:DDE_3 domain-containing protein [Trichonephila clavipes]
MSDPGTFGSGRRECEYIGDYLSIISDQVHPYIAFVFPTGNGIFQRDNIACQKARIVLEGFGKYKDEFQTISWPPNSADLNLVMYLWVFIGRQSRD